MSARGNEELILTRRRTAQHLGSVPGVLDYLGIEHRRSKRAPAHSEFDDTALSTFWQLNAIQLEDIYREFLLEARNRMRELHPDTRLKADYGPQTTDHREAEHEFDQFIKAVNRTKRAFARHLNIAVGEKPRSAQGQSGNLLCIPRDARIRSKTKAFTVMRLLQTGWSQPAISRELRCSKVFILKIRRCCMRGIAIPDCACGRAFAHEGPCRALFDRKAWYASLPMEKRRGPLRAESRERISASMRGRRLTPEHRINIGLGRLGMKHSLETRAKLSVIAKRRAKKTLNAQGPTLNASMQKAA